MISFHIVCFPAHFMMPRSLPLQPDGQPAAANDTLLSHGHAPGIWQWQRQADRIGWSSTVFALHQLPPSADGFISWHSLLALVRPTDRPAIENFRIQLHQGQCAGSLVYQLVSGRDIQWDISEPPLGLPGVVMGIAFEHTTIKTLVAEVSRYREKVRAQREISDHHESLTTSGCWEWNPRTQKLFYSDNLFRLLGCTPGSFEPSLDYLQTFVHPEDRDTMLARSFDGLANMRWSTSEYRIIRSDGAVRHFRGVSKTIRNADGEEMLIGVTRDITDDVTIRQQLEERIAFAELLIDNSVDFIAVYNDNLEFVAWNKASEIKYNLRKEDVLGKKITDVFPSLANDARLPLLVQALQGQTINLGLSPYPLADGHYECFITPLKTGPERISGVLTVTHDITNIKTAEEQLRLLNQTLELKNKALEQSNQELVSFSYVASHDLREPLRKIQAFSGRIREMEYAVLSETSKDFFGRMENAARRMQQLIEDLLAFSRTNATAAEFVWRPLGVLLDEVKMGIRHLIEEKRVTIEADDLPSAEVIPFQFKQLMENLLLNAIKYAKADTAPHIAIRYTYGTADTLSTTDGSLPGVDYHILSVCDNGIGFEPVYAQRIFELFQRLHSHAEYPGSGLGLAICKKIVQNHHGFIQANGRPGYGATFTIYLPVRHPMPTRIG